LTIDEIPAPPSQLEFVEQRDAWAASLDGVDARRTAILVTVTGTEQAPVILTGLKVRVIERRAPMNGTHITYGPLGDAMFVRWMTVDLDRTPPEVTQTADERFLVNGDGEARPVTFPFKVSSAEPKCSSSWRPRSATTASGGTSSRGLAKRTQGVAVINDDGQPFRTTPPPRRSRTCRTTEPRSRSSDCTSGADRAAAGLQAIGQPGIRDAPGPSGRGQPVDIVARMTRIPLTLT
jgi:hypothetical protein